MCGEKKKGIHTPPPHVCVVISCTGWDFSLLCISSNIIYTFLLFSSFSLYSSVALKRHCCGFWCICCIYEYFRYKFISFGSMAFLTVTFLWSSAMRKKWFDITTSNWQSPRFQNIIVFLCLVWSLQTILQILHTSLCQNFFRIQRPWLSCDGKKNNYYLLYFETNSKSQGMQKWKWFSPLL